MTHLLNIHALGDEDVKDYALYRFNGREALSESFLYQLELLTSGDPDCSQLIGKLCEFDVAQGADEPRVFAGRIYAARKLRSGDLYHVHVVVRPAYHALSYAKDTHFAQDKHSIDIFEAMTKDVIGLVKEVQASSPSQRIYSVRIDEYENEFLDRLLSHDGIFYYFFYDRGGGAYRHKMILGDSSSSYKDVPGGSVRFLPNDSGGGIKHLERIHGATAQSQDSANFSSMNSHVVNTGSDTMPDFAKVYSHETKAFLEEESDSSKVKTALKERHEQDSDFVKGSSDNPQLFAGGKVEITEAGSLTPSKLVLTSVVHEAVDPWMLDGSGTGSYRNSFTGIDASKTFRPPVDKPQRIAPGPLLGVVGKKTERMAKGAAEVDDKYRVPVLIDGARDYSDDGLNAEVWLPVRQQWGADSTHGAQFIPRAGSRVVVSFLNGNPNMPYVDGVLYSHDGNKYPDAHGDAALRTGFRSVTNEDGGVKQEFFFEDKDGEERIYLYTDRNYEREVVNDELGKIGNDQDIEIDNDKRLTVHNDRTTQIDGKCETTVTGKRYVYSTEEIELKVGQSSIKMTPSEIVIKSMNIKVDATVALDMKAVTEAKLKALMTEVSGDAMLTLKGGVVMIN